MPTVFLIRHAESQSNAGLPTIGPKQVELTPLGHEQAKYIATLLQSYALLNLIVTSPYLRTKQTANPVIATFDSIPTEEWSVQEFTYLSSLHHKYSTIADRKPLVDAYWEQLLPFHIVGPDAESFAQFIERVNAFLKLLRNEKYEKQTIAVFSHEQFINAVLWLIDHKQTEISSKMMRDFRHYLDLHSLGNGAIVMMRYSENNARWLYKPIIKQLDREHLVLTAATETPHLKHSEPAPDPPILQFGTPPSIPIR